MIYIKIIDGWASHIDTNPHSDSKAEKLKGNYPAEEFSKLLHLVDGELIIDTQDNRDAYDTEQSEIRALAVKKFPKLAIRRAMRVLGKEASLDNLLASEPTFKIDWDTQTDYIDIDDPVASQAIIAYGGNIDDIKLQIAGL